MKGLRTITTLILVFISGAVVACDCSYAGSFVEIAKQTKLVALVKIKKYTRFTRVKDVRIPVTMEVEIIEQYKGKESRKNILIFGHFAQMCGRPQLSVFNPGQYYVMALYPGDTVIGHLKEKVTDYTTSNCGQY